MDIVCLSSQTARSAGDALRELDSMDVSRKNPSRGLTVGAKRRSTILPGALTACFELRHDPCHGGAQKAQRD